jgi:hypothetical protein
VVVYFSNYIHENINGFSCIIRTNKSGMHPCLLKAGKPCIPYMSHSYRSNRR